MNFDGSAVSLRLKGYSLFYVWTVNLWNKNDNYVTTLEFSYSHKEVFSILQIFLKNPYP